MVYQQIGNTTLQMFSFNRDFIQLKYLGLIDVTMILMTNQVILPLIANTKKKSCKSIVSNKYLQIPYRDIYH